MIETTSLIDVELQRSFRELDRRLVAAGIDPDVAADNPSPVAQVIMDEVLAMLSPAAKDTVAKTGFERMIQDLIAECIAAGTMTVNDDGTYSKITFTAPEGTRDAVMQTLQFPIAEQGERADALIAAAGPRIRTDGYLAGLEAAEAAIAAASGSFTGDVLLRRDAISAIRDVAFSIRRNMEKR